ncbi:MAG TPA: hypothetical protein V6C97_16490 [Oculatellaceae cyanobacterium]
MNLLQLLTTLRKFGNFAVGIFPLFTVIGAFLAKNAENVAKKWQTTKLGQQVSNSSAAQAFWKVIERFYWRSYSKNRLDLSEAPVESLIVLRPIFQLLVWLCVLIPFTQIPIFPIHIEAFSGFSGSAPAWSVLLWIIALPCAWASLLCGAAVSNRAVFCIVALGATYFLNTCVVMLPRSYFNAFAGLAVLFALACCEFTHRCGGKRCAVVGVTNSLLVGAAAGTQMFVMTPIKPWLSTFVKLPGAVIGIGGGIAIGVVLGLLVFFWARKSPRRNEQEQNNLLGPCVWTTAAMLFVYLIAALCRGDLTKSGTLVYSSIALSNNYLWPLWYFLGVGIIHKILGSTKVIADAITNVIPKRILSLGLITALILSLLVLGSEPAAIYLSAKTGIIAETMCTFFVQIYNFSKPYIWNIPLTAIAVHWTLWVVAADALIVAILAAQRRLNAGVLARLLFMTLFAYFVICEYIFQLSSFMRTPTHSVLVLFFFSVWLLWLLHTIGWNMSTKSSPLWPARGRLAIYAGICALAILEIHSRAASQDFTVANELFLTMFHGVIDVGLPYFFLVWASKKLKTMPTRVPAMLGMLCLGGVVSLSFNFLDKFATAGWSWSQLSVLLQKQTQLLNSVGTVNLHIDVPVSWLLPKAALYVVLLFAVLFALKVRARSGGLTPDTTGTANAGALVILLVAFGSGVASFSKTLIELPLPIELRVATAPMTQELIFNCNVMQSYLAYWIPALLLGLAHCLLASGKREKYLAGMALAGVGGIASCYLISWMYVKYGVLLRATNTLYLLMAMIAGVFAVLVAITLQQLRKQEQGLEVEVAPKAATTLEEPAREETPHEAIRQEAMPPQATRQDSLLTPKTFVITVAVLEALCLPVFLTHYRFQLMSVPAPTAERQIKIPNTWKLQAQIPGGTTVYSRKLEGGGESILQLGAQPPDPRGNMKALGQLMLRAMRRHGMNKLKPLKIESWDIYYPDAAVAIYQFEGNLKGATIPIVGITVLVPRVGYPTESYSIYTMPSELDQAQTELAYIIQRQREAR